MLLAQTYGPQLLEDPGEGTGGEAFCLLLRGSADDARVWGRRGRNVLLSHRSEMIANNFPSQSPHFNLPGTEGESLPQRGR